MPGAEKPENVLFSVEKAKVALAQLPNELRGAVRRFRRLTGFVAVTSLGEVNGKGWMLSGIVPPIHPRCVKLGSGAVAKLPCAAEWRKHIRYGLRTRRCKTHTCPLGLRCACVPVLFGAHLVGLCKFVADRKVSDKEFSTAAELLEGLVERAAQKRYLAVLESEVVGLHRRMARMRCAKRLPVRLEPDQETRSGNEPSGSDGPNHTFLVNRALDYLGNHYMDPEFSLSQVAHVLRVSEKYLAHVFAQRVGRRMHTCLNERRIQRACELLLTTDWQIKRIAYETGFAGGVQFNRTFRRHVGVAPRDYRRVFLPPG